MKKYLTTAVILFAATSAFADDARKINFRTLLTDADGMPMTECKKVISQAGDCPDKDKINITLGDISMRALVNPEHDLTADKSLQRGQLALSVYKSESSVLTVEEIALIKSQIAKSFSPLIVVRAFAILDPK